MNELLIEYAPIIFLLTAFIILSCNYIKSQTEYYELDMKYTKVLQAHNFLQSENIGLREYSEEQKKIAQAYANGWYGGAPIIPPVMHSHDTITDFDSAIKARTAWSETQQRINAANMNHPKDGYL